MPTAAQGQCRGDGSATLKPSALAQGLAARAGLAAWAWGVIKGM